MVVEDVVGNLDGVAVKHVGDLDRGIDIDVTLVMVEDIVGSVGCVAVCDVGGLDGRIDVDVMITVTLGMTVENVGEDSDLVVVEDVLDLDGDLNVDSSVLSVEQLVQDGDELLVEFV